MGHECCNKSGKEVLPDFGRYHTTWSPTPQGIQQKNCQTILQYNAKYAEEDLSTQQ